MKQILVADDDKNLTFALSHRLAIAGYGVLTANNADEALEVILEEKPDLVLMDVWMPPGFGLSVAERLRALHIATPIIFLTGSQDSDVSRVVEQIGAATCIEKPYDPNHLLTTIARAVACPASGEPFDSLP